MSFKQKLQYFHLGFVYLVAAFVMPFFFLAPILALLTNNFVLIAPVRSYVLHRFPYFIAMSVAYGIISYPTPLHESLPDVDWTFSNLYPCHLDCPSLKKEEARLSSKCEANWKDRKEKPLAGHSSSRRDYLAFYFLSDLYIHQGSCCLGIFIF